MKKDKKKKLPSVSIGGISEDALEAVTGGVYGHDYYDPYRCYTPIADSRCHIRDPGARCRYFNAERLDSGKYRYICAKGCFDYISDNELH